MSSNKKTFRPNKLGKAIKATLPLFVMLGGGAAAASTRNFSASSGSRRISATSVVHVRNTDEPIKLNQRIDNNVSKKATVFGAFTKGQSKVVKAAEIKVDTAALDFLKENDLLNSGASVKAQLSGNTLGRKTFVDFCHSVDVRAYPAALYAPSTLFPGAVIGAGQRTIMTGNTNQAACTAGGNIWHVTNAGVCTYYPATNTNAVLCVVPGPSYYWKNFNVISTVGGAVPNTPPIATAQTVSAVEDIDKTITLAGFDGDTDPLTAIISALPDNGVLYQTVDGTTRGAQITAVPTTVLSATKQVIYVSALNGNGIGHGNFGFKVNDTIDDSLQTIVTVNVSAVNDAPTLGGITAVTNIDDIATATPFSAFTVADVDSPAQSQTVSVTLDTAAKGSFTTLNGFADAGAGVYTFSGTAAATQTAIRGLVFTPTSNRVASGLTETTTFTVSVDDGVAAAVTNNATTVVSTSVNDAPTITGASAGQAVNDNATVSPFTGVTLGDADSPAQTQAVSVTLDVAAKGSFTTLNGFTDAGAGVYTFSGTAAAATTAINGLVFTPTADRVNPTLTETTTFTISVDDGVVATAVTNNATTVIATAVNDAPAIGGATAVTNINDTATATPFSAFTVADADTNQSQSVSVTLDVAAKGSFTTLNGFADAGAGVYTFTGTAAAAQTAIRGLVFTPTANRVTPTTTETTTFTVSVDDAIAAAVTNSVTTVVTTSVNDAPTLGGITAVTNIDDIATATPFSAFTVADVDSPAQSQTVSVTLDTAAKGSFTTLNGFTDATGGVYTYSGTAATAQTAIRGLVFTPAANRVATGLTETTTFTVSVDDGVAAAVTDANTTVVSTSVNDVPTITGAVAAQAVDDNATASPFTAVTIGDTDSPAQTQSVSVTLDSAAKGSFTTLNGFTDATGGVYTFSGTAADATTAIRGLVFTPAANRVNPTFTETTTFTISTNDGVAAAVTDNTTTVVSTSINDAPTVGGATAVTNINDTATASPFTTFTIADADATQNQSVSVSLDDAAKGSITTLNGFTDAGGGIYTFSGTAAAAQTAIRGLVFTPAANRVASGLTETTTFTVSVNDGIAVAVTENTTTVVSTSVNDAPTLNLDLNDSSAAGGNNYTTTFASGGTAVTIADVDTTIVDVDASATVAAAQLILSGVLDGANESITIAGVSSGATFPATSIVVTYTSATQIDLAGVDSAANYQTVIEAITYNNTTAAISTTVGARTVSVTVVDDGALGSVAAVSTINVTKAPIIDLDGVAAGTGYAGTFTEAGGGVAISSTATITDDQANLNQMVVLLTNNLDGGVESITIPGVLTGNTYGATVITVTYAANQVTLAGADTHANYLAALGAIRYDNTSAAPNLTARSITVQATDTNTHVGPLSTATLSMVAVNDAPVIANNTGFTVLQATNYILTTADLQFTDVDNIPAQLTYTVTTAPGAGQLENLGASGVAITSFTQADIDAGNIVFAHNGAEGLADSFIVSISDGTATVTNTTVNVTVTPVPDLDGDGMTNVYEDANGLDKWDAADRDTDLDGDGVSNYLEYVANTDATADDYPPVVTPPTDVTTNASGLFTPVDTGMASADDGLDGTLPPTSNAPTHFAPGITTVIWSATDAAGNTGTATQLVNVNPQVNFSKDQITSEDSGSTTTFSAILNGPAVSYPVSVFYTVSGSATSVANEDYNPLNGSITINSGTSTAEAITIVNDGAGEGTENIIITMDTTTNAVAGSNSVHTIDIVEGNVAPTVTLGAEQGGFAAVIVPVGDGVVTVLGSVVDPNIGNTHTYDWSATDNALVDGDGDTLNDTFLFDPSGLTPGLYTLRLSVTDSAAATEASELLLNVVATAPVLTTADSDGDGVDDQTEGYSDSDNDGIPDYLDAIAGDNVLQEHIGVSTSHVLETEFGLKLQLSKFALLSGNGRTVVTMTDIINLGGHRDDANSYAYPGGLFDFIVSELPVAGQSAQVVLAQLAPVPERSGYRKMTPVGWQNFVENANNQIASAAGVEGYCPPPGDGAYTAGLTAGHWCVQLTLEDGGPNDFDGVANKRIVDPGGVAEILASDVSVSVTSGGGGVAPLWLLLMGLLGLPRLLASRKGRGGQ